MNLNRLYDITLLPLDIITERVLGPFDHHLEDRSEPEKRISTWGYHYTITSGRYFRCRQRLSWLVRRIPHYGRPGHCIVCYNGVMKNDTTLFITEDSTVTADEMVNHSGSLTAQSFMNPPI